jgi:excisionase family DNA binding protein
MDRADIRPKLVDIRETMTQIPVKSRTTVYELVDRRELVAVKVGSRTFITQESIDAFIDRLAADALKPREDSKGNADAAESNPPAR